MSTLIFLEIKDIQAVDLLTRVRSALLQRTSRSPIHITIRGPYKVPPPDQKLGDIWEIIEGEGVLLHGIGIFEFPDKHVVFLKSHSRAIRKIWWKRDYPIIRFGFNPHITLFEGSPSDAAAVARFLQREQIELFCREFSLSTYQSWQDDLFSSPTRTIVRSSPRKSNSVLSNPYRWKSGIEIRAQQLILDLKNNKSRQLDLDEA
ncbi:2'-5' RNA ligase family protein [Variovorax arabinosiphilus]|uniref:2'-5' RNA ligase family protein n=1 Tax=Variovorax arabinosiphilus TaxID=3053498 RepID=UPI002578BE2F|nr:hypothetical protein [Variovorax sp. J2L1-78]MDM0122633.1 hypothetical protein [Variovorax sp. J2L1-78]